MPNVRAILTPDTLLLLQQIAESGSFAAAARQRNMVPSALTYRVRQVEDALDVLLFDRSSRQARLTEAGAELLREGARLLADIDALGAARQARRHRLGAAIYDCRRRHHRQADGHGIVRTVLRVESAHSAPPARRSAFRNAGCAGVRTGRPRYRRADGRRQYRRPRLRSDWHARIRFCRCTTPLAGQSAGTADR